MTELVIAGHQLTLTDQSREGKIRFIENLVNYLGADFFVYADNPVDYSAKVNKVYSFLIRTGPILFLPFDIEESLNVKDTNYLENLLGCRIKYIDNKEDLLSLV